MGTSLPDQVLHALLEAGGEPLSGQTLAAHLGVTRAGVWKCVENLRLQGYEIESITRKGYRLEATLGAPRPGEVEAQLSTRVMGRAHRHLTEVDSTNREAARWADGADGTGDPAPEGAVVTADAQTAGRGRLGRSWHSAPGEGLFTSVVLRPEVGLADAPLLTFVAAIALAQALADWTGDEAVQIKWPNDVLLHGRKVAGILLESRTEGSRVDHVILGVGVNVAGDPDRFPEEFREAAITLAAALGEKPCPTVATVLSRFLERLEALYDRFVAEGFEPLRDDWARWFRMTGREVTVTTDRARTRGRVAGLDAAGALLLETEGPHGKETIKIHAGDVALSTTKERADAAGD